MPADHKQVAQDLIRDDPRGRCAKHRDTPGPSLYFDCCESERLREGWQRTEAALAATRSALANLVAVAESYMPTLAVRLVDPTDLATALTRARETGVG